MNTQTLRRVGGSLMALGIAAAAAAPASAQVRVLEDAYRSRNQQAPAAAPGAPAPANGLPIEHASVAINPSQPFMLHRGYPIHTQLQAWARHGGWELIWHPPVSWRVIGDANLNNHRDVAMAVSAVINILRDEGKGVRLRIAEGNRVMEVLSTDVRGD